jgi:hypothetical protein
MIAVVAVPADASLILKSLDWAKWLSRDQRAEGKNSLPTIPKPLVLTDGMDQIAIPGKGAVGTLR